MNNLEKNCWTSNNCPVESLNEIPAFQKKIQKQKSWNNQLYIWFQKLKFQEIKSIDIAQKSHLFMIILKLA